MIGRRDLAVLLGVLMTRRPAAAQSPPNLGALTPFYRCTQLQGFFVGMGLEPIPQYMLGDDIDLKYRRNPALKSEIPFVDSFTINRFLGGYNTSLIKRYHVWDDQLGRRSRDYVIRNASGTLQYRPELISEHLAPYLEAGYQTRDITVALENVPWDLAEPPKEGTWGQQNPPGDMQEWQSAISHFAEDLKAYLGPAARDIGFETGVEYDERVSFDASAQQFYQYYAATYRGLKVVLPDAVLNPGEFTGIGECPPGVRTCVYDTQAFVEFCRANGIVVRIVPRSLHAVFSSSDPSPSVLVRRAEISYGRIPGAIPEIHQFGLLGQPFGGIDVGSDVGAAQASWHFQVLMGLWQRLRPRRVFHWGCIDSIGSYQFLNGQGVLRLVLDRYLGARFVMLSIAADSDRGAPTDLMAVGVSGSVAAVIASSFSRQMSAETNIVRVGLPDGFMKSGAGRLKVLRYSTSDNVFTTVRQHLAADDNLKQGFLDNPFCVSDPMTMAKDRQRAHVTLRKNWPAYVDIMKRDLRWQPIEHETWIEGRSTLRSKLEANELLVVEAESGN